MRHCSLCDQNLPDTAFGKNRTTRDGFQGYCRDCTARKRKEKNENVRRQPLFCAACQKMLPSDQFSKKRTEPLCCLSCKAKSKADYGRQFRIAHKSELKNYLAAYRKNYVVRRPEGYNAERAQKVRERYHADPDYRAKILASARQRKTTRTVEQKREDYQKRCAWVKNTGYQEKINERACIYRKERRPLVADHKKRYNIARYVRDPSTAATMADIKRLHAWQRNRCYYCNCSIEQDSTVDHIIPRAKGGGGEPENIVLCCPKCNMSKGARLFGTEWRPSIVHELPMDHFFVSPSSVSAFLTRSGFAFERQDQSFIVHGNGVDKEIIVLSSFAVSERYAKSNRHAVALNKGKPDALILFDFDFYGRSESIANLLRAKVHVADRTGARKLSPEFIGPQEARAFLNAHHLMGFGAGNFYVGLRASDNSLFGVGAFKDQGETFDCARLAFHGHVAGGMSRIIEFLWRNAERKTILSFVDSRYANGSGHETIGFSYISKSPPIFKWVYPNKVQHYRYLNNDNKARLNLRFLDDALPRERNILANGVFKLWSGGLHKISLPA